MTQLDRNALNYGRSRPMYDGAIHRHLEKLLSPDNVFEKNMIDEFREAFSIWITQSEINQLENLEEFKQRDVINGVTHSLDDLHARYGAKLVVLPKEYKYHQRINPNVRILSYQNWQNGDVAIVSFPFSHTGNEPQDWSNILAHCEKNDIDLHIDAAWFGIARDIKIDLSSRSIKSISFSLSKCLGLGNYPIGVRFAKTRGPGPVSVVNDFQHLNPLTCFIGLGFIRKFHPDYFQKKYYEAYKQVVNEFDLIESKSIHIALENNGDDLIPVGIRGFLRQIVDGEFK